MQESLKVTGKDAAKILLAEFQLREAKSRHRSKALAPARRGLEEIIAEYARGKGREKTKGWYEWCGSEFKEFCQGRGIDNAGDIYSDTVEAFYQARRQKGLEQERERLEKDEKAKTKSDPGGAASILRGIKAILNYAVKKGYIHENPAKMVKSVKPTKKLFRDLSFEEMDALLKAAKEHGPSYYAMFATAYYAGLREGELIWLKPGDISLEQGYVDVKSKAENMIKDHAERRIPLNGKLKEILLQHKPGKKWLFETREGTPRKINLNRELKRAAKHAKIEVRGLNMRVLRETFGSHLRRRGVDIALISQYMGHSSTDVTLRHYAHIRIEQTQKEIDLL